MNITKTNLNEALKRTRQQKTYLSLTEIADVIRDNFDPEEIEALVKEITITASEEYPLGNTVEPYDLANENEDDIGAIV